MKCYSLEGHDLARAIRAMVVEGRSVSDLPALVSQLQQLCEAEAKLLAGGRKEDVESEVQSLLVAALRSDLLQFPQPGTVPWGVVSVHHSPMGGGRSEREGALLRRAGARAGWPDLDIRLVDRLGVRRSVLLELKVHGGRVSKEQKETIKGLVSAGFEARVVVGLVESVGVVVRVIGGELPFH